ncbi:MAG TPA: hypothetical protein VIG24_15105 [Acidimicrobiia bacterium]
MSADEFLKVQRDIEDAQVPRRTHPKGWEPGVDTAKGTLVVQGGDTPPTDWSVIIRELGLDPEAWTVDENARVEVRTWDSGDKRNYYYKATVLPRHEVATSPDVEALIREVKRRKPARKRQETTTERALVVCLADWQAGKGDGKGGGVEQLLERLWALRAAVPERVRELRKAGIEVSTITVLSMGDLSESCDGHYAAQTFQVELDYREQARLVRRMLVEMLSEWVKLAPNMQVACVPANHGERRKNGKMFTNWGDNTDVEVFEVVREALAHNPDVYGHIRWAIPDQEQYLSIDVCGTVIGIVHGHQFTNGSGPQGKAMNWWKNMAMNRTAVGDADVLVSGHFHHLQVMGEGVADSPKGRTWMQCPALDCGSEWWEHMGGAPTQQGTLTFTADAGGWDNLKVLR